MPEQSEVGEIWVDVSPTDIVIIDHYHERVVVGSGLNEHHVDVAGALARKQGGAWMKCMHPPTFIDPHDVGQKIRDHQYIRGAQLSELPHDR